MKYVIVLGDGMADEPIEAAGGKTPLQLADKPVMDEMAKVSEQGIAYTVPSNLPAGSDVANLSMLGYDPQVYYSGRSPLEALSIGVDMKDTDTARSSVLKHHEVVQVRLLLHDPRSLNGGS